MEKIIQNHYGSGDNVKEKHEHHYHESPHIIPKVLTSQVGLANNIDFVGRKDALREVDELLNQNSMLLLLNGIGGIGKSTLASYYLNQKKDDFDYYGFVQVDDNIKIAFASAFSTSLDLKSEKIDEQFAEIMNKLQNLEGKKLLIIDDIKEMDNQADEINTLMTLKNNGFQILFTSRETIEHIPQYFLDIMNIEDARELFLKYYPTDEIDKVDKIIEYLDYHTLFIELTAKTLKEKSHSLNLDIILDKFENGEFNTIKRSRKANFNRYLNQLFDRDSILTDDEILLFLKKLSILPSIEISFEDLYEFLGCYNKENFEETLIELVNNGWLIQTQNGYKFHQILKEFILENYIIEFEEIKKTINNFRSLISNSGDHKNAIYNEKYIIYLDSILNVVIKYSFFRFETVFLLLQYANILFSLGRYDVSYQIRKQALEISEKINDYICLASCYDAIANYYFVMQQYKQALPYYKSAFEIYQIIPKYNEGNQYLSQTKITNLNNYATLLENMDELDAAEEIYNYVLSLDSDNEGSLHGLAIVHCRRKDYKKGYNYFKRSLKLFSEELHPDIAIIYNNMSFYYMQQKKFEKALYFINKAIDIRETLLPCNHPELQQAYNDRTHIENILKIFKSSSKKPNRNDPSPCGSEKKYKKCCGK
jgi:tetratricopeptide (TPR) repeat protein